MSPKLTILIILALAPLQSFAQTPAAKARRAVRATEELESIIVQARTIDDKMAQINVSARAAALLSFSDPARAESSFLEIWKLAKQQDDTAFDKERAAALILKYLSPRNPRLAKRLLAEEIPAGDASLQQRVTGRDPGLRKLARVAAEMVDQDPTAASALLERALSQGITPAGLGSLFRLREKDPLLADFVVAKSLHNLEAQPTVVSLSGLHILTAYVFPAGGSFVPLPGNSSSLESLQFQYFSTTYDVLKTSMLESSAALRDQHYTDGDLHFRAIYQGQVAMVLAALAARYQPGAAEELGLIAKKTIGQLPPDVAEMSQFTATRLSGAEVTSGGPEVLIPLAISSGDFSEARRLIDQLKNQDARKAYSQVTVKAQARALLSQAQVLEALVVIREIDDPNARLVFYLDALKLTQKKEDELLAKSVLSEARTIIPQVDRNGLHVRALLVFSTRAGFAATVDETFAMLDSAVGAINSLPKKPDQPSATKTSYELAWEHLNDPISLLDSQEVEQAFSSAAVLDFERSVINAGKIQIRPVQLLAKLGAISEVVKSSNPKPKVVIKSPMVSLTAPIQK